MREKEFQPKGNGTKRSHEMTVDAFCLCMTLPNKKSNRLKFGSFVRQCVCLWLRVIIHDRLLKMDCGLTHLLATYLKRFIIININTQWIGEVVGMICKIITMNVWKKLHTLTRVRSHEKESNQLGGGGDAAAAAIGGNTQNHCMNVLLSESCPIKQ